LLKTTLHLITACTKEVINMNKFGVL